MSGTSPSFGIPGINTGNATWSQGLGSLASALFPNPASVAQAGYYGAQTRKTNLESLRLQEQFAAAHRALMMQPDTGQPPPSPIQFTGNLPGQPPILAEPSNLPGQGTQGGPAPAPAPAPAPTSTSTPTLGQTVSPPGGQGGPVASAPPGAASAGGAPPVQPEALASVLAPGAAPFAKGFGATGTPPPAAPPVPGAPPAPNTTTSNGQVPTDNQGDGPLRMDAITSPDGGQKFSSPANPDGSPQQIQFSPGTYLAMQAMAGRNAEESRVQAVGYIMAMGQKGIIPMPAAVKLASAFGSPTYGTDVGAQTALAQTGMTVAGNIKQAQIGADASRDVANIGQTGANFRFGQTPLATQGVGPSGTPTVQFPGQTPQGAPVFNQGMAVLDNQPVEVVDANGRITTTTFKNARNNNLQLTPKSLDQIHALALQAGMQGNVQPATGAGAAAIAMTPATPMTQQEQIGSGNSIDKMAEQGYAQPEGWGRTLDVQLDPNEKSDVMVRAQELYNQRGPTYHNAATSTSTAMQQLQQTGHMPTSIQLQSMFDLSGKYLGNDPRIKAQVAPTGKVSSRYVVPQLKPYQPGAIDVAPQGLQEGQQVQTPNGMRGIVHNGFVYPTTQAPLSRSVAPQQ